MTGLHLAAAYLAGFLACATIGAGALLLLFSMRLANASWFVPLRGATEAVASLVPALALLFVPIALSLGRLYPWAGARLVSDGTDPAAIAHAGGWLSRPFFVARALAIVAIWSLLALAWRHAKSRERRTAIAAAGIPILFLTLTLAVFDWVLSLAPGFVSDAAGFVLAASAFGAAVALVVLIVTRAGRARELGLRPDHLHALGRVLWVGVILWAYVAFCQFLIVWIADVPAEIPFYADRVSRGWTGVTWALVALRFALPFVLLASRSLKRSYRWMSIVATCVLVSHVVEATWLVVPFGERRFAPLDLIVVAAMTLAWCAAASRLARSSAAPREGDPEWEAALRYESP